MSRMIITKYAKGQTNNRGIVVASTTINITVVNPSQGLAAILSGLGYRASANDNGITGDMEIDCYTPAEVDAARNPLRGLVHA